MRKILLSAALLLLCVFPCVTIHAADLTQGHMLAVPAQKQLNFQGDLSDWDFSAAEPIWIAAETAEKMHGSIALMYDSDAIYFAAKVTLPGRPIHNPNNPVDAFWGGDMLELRLSSDPAHPNPLPGDVALKDSNRICHLSFWKNSTTNKDYINIAFGSKFDKGHVVNPPGSQIVITTHGSESYTVASRIPWSALNVPDGKNPFGVGGKTCATLSIHWGGENQTPALFRTNPGAFAFHHPETWGTLEFCAKGNLPPRHGTMEQALAVTKPKPVGVPIEMDIPDDGLKISVNIFDDKGAVLRELVGGESRGKGKTTVYFDGHDQWGNPLSPGKYTWGAYFSKGLGVKFMGSAGVGGHPPYQTADGKGGWGGDHGPAIDVAADQSGRYFLWVVGEAGTPVVKTDYKGEVIWRKNPFVGGGFGPFFAIATNEKYVFLSLGKDNPKLVRLDAASGQLLTFPDNSSTAPISNTKAVAVAPESSPVGEQPETCGLAANATEVFAPLYSQNLIRVLNSESGKMMRDLPCPAPRGVALDAQGNLFAISYIENASPRIVKFIAAAGEPVNVIQNDLSAPWHLSLDSKGLIYVSDLGASQQIKLYSTDGKLLRAMGKAGGRAWSGKYDQDNFLLPSGVAIDAHGGLLTAESSLPKVMSLFDAASGKLLNRWFGSIAYSGLDVPDPNDPWTVYYPVTPDDGIVRATIPHAAADMEKPAELRLATPDAYWSMARDGRKEFDSVYAVCGAPNILTTSDGRRYMYGEAGGHTICRMEGDRLIPVASFTAKYYNNFRTHNLEIWCDNNADEKKQPDEFTILDTLEGKPLPGFASSPGSMYMHGNGDVYINTWGNKILMIPASGIDSHGVIHWDFSKAHFAIPVVMESWKDHSPAVPREGPAGFRMDSYGNFYTCFNAAVPYATKELTAMMREGLGHSAGSTAVKFAKYAPDGQMLWLAGRKATAAAKAGEMYHMWVLAGLIGDQYISAASEWGQMYVYTHDGFFVDALMNNCGLAPEAGPYTFGSETFGGRIQDFPQRNEVWAYSCGFAYQITGIDHGKIAGEQRIKGSVQLDRVYETAVENVAAQTPLRIVPMKDPFKNENAWSNVPTSTILKSAQPLSTMQLGYDAQNLFVRAHVIDDSPLQNSADNINTAFHGGDAVGLYLGPATRSGELPAMGDIHILAAKIGGQAKLIAMKPLTNQTKHPEEYVTPAGGKVEFAFVGEIPNAQVTLTPDLNGHGYTATFAIPLVFLEISITKETSIGADLQVLLSGQGARGLQTLSRHYLFTPLNSQTNMIDDVPTEAKLYPQYWGKALIE